MKGHEFRLRFPESQIAKRARDYSYSQGDTEPANWGPAIKRRGYMTKPEFLDFCR